MYDTIKPPPIKKEPPKSPFLWAFRGVRGTKEVLIDAIAESKAPDEVKAYLTWAINSREGAGFRIDSQGVAGHDGELFEHTHIERVM